MAASKKGAFTIGLVMAISFGVVLFLMFSEIFPGPAGKKVNGLDWADDLFNKLAKGSSYFIPKLKETNQKFMGRPFTATIKIPNAAEADQINKLGQNNAITMAVNTTACFVAYNAVQWYTLPFVPS